MTEPSREDLEARIIELEEALASPELAAPQEWGLTPQEAYMLRILVTRGRQITVRQMVIALEQHEHGEFTARKGDDLTTNLVYVIISRIRQKLASFGWKIPRAFHGTYHLSHPQTEALKSAMSGGPIHAEEHDL